MKLKTLAEVMAEVPEDERHKIEARAQELIMEEEARRAKRGAVQQSGNGTDDAFTLDAPVEIEDAEPLTRPAD